MLDIGFSELLLTGTVALVVLGPEKLPKVARTVGQWLGRAQRYVNDVKADIAREGEMAELRKLKEQIENAGRDVEQTIRKEAGEVQQTFDQGAASLRNDLSTDPNNPAYHDPGNAALPAPGNAGGLPDPSAHGGPSHLLDPDRDPVVQRMEIDLLIDDISRLESRLSSLRKNAQSIQMLINSQQPATGASAAAATASAAPAPAVSAPPAAEYDTMAAEGGMSHAPASAAATEPVATRS
jgi:sec-independent protein translocase protein TatB